MEHSLNLSFAAVNVPFLMHKLCHIFLSVRLRFKLALCPNPRTEPLIQQLFTSQREVHITASTYWNHFHPNMWHIAVNSTTMQPWNCPTPLSLSHGSIWQLATNSKRTAALVLQRERHLPVCRLWSSSTLQLWALSLQASSVSGKLTFSPAAISISSLVPELTQDIDKILVFIN